MFLQQGWKVKFLVSGFELLAKICGLHRNNSGVPHSPTVAIIEKVYWSLRRRVYLGQDNNLFYKMLKLIQHDTSKQEFSMTTNLI